MRRSNRLLEELQYRNFSPSTIAATDPSALDIKRTPTSTLCVDIAKMDNNPALSDDKCVFDHPEGTKLQVIGRPPAASLLFPSEGRKI